MYFLKLIMKNNLNFYLLPRRFTRFPLKYQHMPLSIFKKGVIRCKELDACSNNEIIAGLFDQHVIYCCRVTVQRNIEAIYTNILSFNTPATRSTQILVRVEQYLPAPLCCTKCQKLASMLLKVETQNTLVGSVVNITNLITATQKILQYVPIVNGFIHLQKMPCF